MAISADLAAQLSAIHGAAFHPHSRPWSAEEITSLSDTAHLVLAEETNGFALFSAVGDEAELLTIAISPSVQGKGHGQVLLTKTIAAACKQGVRKMFLEVAADNTSALALYAKFGFEEIGRRKAYYKRSNGPRVDALILSHLV
ncbi:MAG: ribosomal protein S18-alanine N-acetyltransferase [Pikeienuella sp.]